MAKSTYCYKQKPRSQRNQPYVMDPELHKALTKLEGYELTLGYDKLTDYLRVKHKKIWNHKKVYAHMQQLQLLQPKHIKRRYRKNRRLEVSCPIRSNLRWEADLTFVLTGMGKVYLFIVEDVYDKEILSGNMSIRARSLEAVESLRRAISQRFGNAIPTELQLTLRIDRGCQYTAEEFERFACDNGIALEFCGVQAPNDKPFIESFISCYKREEVYRNHYENFFQAFDGWKQYMHWYNNKRPHGSLNNLTPAQFRAQKNSIILI